MLRKLAKKFKDDLPVFLISETFAIAASDWNPMLSGISAAVGVTWPLMHEAITTSQELPPRFVAPRRRSRFMNTDVATCIAAYSGECPLSPTLPYKEVCSFTDLIANGRKPHVGLDFAPGDFTLARWNDPIFDEIVTRGYADLVNEKRVTRKSNTIRVPSISPTKDGATLLIQRAQYKQQAQSNLILDYRLTADGSTLRHGLRRDYGSALPPLHEPRLANTLGCAALVFCYSGDAIVPFFQLRSRDVAIFNEGAWHCTSSGAAEWPDDPQNTPKTFEAYIEDDMRAELLQEVGLHTDDVQLELVAICREFARGGKPQLFYLGYTDLSPAAIARRAETARKQQVASRQADPLAEPVETQKRPLLHEARDFRSMADIDLATLRYGFTSEAAACLYYFFRLMDASA